MFTFDDPLVPTPRGRPVPPQRIPGPCALARYSFSHAIIKESDERTRRRGNRPSKSPPADVMNILRNHAPLPGSLTDLAASSSVRTASDRPSLRARASRASRGTQKRGGRGKSQGRGKGLSHRARLPAHLRDPHTWAQSESPLAERSAGKHPINGPECMQP